MIRWLFRMLLTMLAARLLLHATRRVQSRAARPAEPAGGQSFHPGAGSGREKSPRSEALSPHPIEDADYEDLPRSSG